MKKSKLIVSVFIFIVIMLVAYATNKSSTKLAPIPVSELGARGYCLCLSAQQRADLLTEKCGYSRIETAPLSKGQQCDLIIDCLKKNDIHAITAMSSVYGLPSSPLTKIFIAYLANNGYPVPAASCG